MKNLSDKEKLDYLYDREAISQTVRKFFMALDEQKWDDILDLIDDKFLLSASSFAGNSDRVDAKIFLRNLVARNGGFLGTTHLNPGHIIDIDGDVANVKAHMYCPHWVDESDEGRFLSSGRYVIDLVRRDDAWRMTTLVIHSDDVRGDPASVYAAAAARMAGRLPEE